MDALVAIAILASAGAAGAGLLHWRIGPFNKNMLLVYTIGALLGALAVALGTQVGAVC